jgi:4-hydroxy-4-methyl-2-oxoglutarate aldolase
MIVGQEVEIMSRELIQQIRAFPTATLHEAMGKYGALPSGIKPISPEMKVCGTAVTVHSMPRDNMMLHRAIAQAATGDVIIAHVSDFWEAGYWGEIMAVAAQARGIAGLVIDGCVRDADPITALGFPVFARGLCIHGTTKFGDGTLNQPITIGQVTIHPGDVIVGDRDGVVIVPADRLAETITKAQAREDKEAQVMSRLRDGETTLEIYGWQ